MKSKFQTTHMLNTVNWLCHIRCTVLSVLVFCGLSFAAAITISANDTGAKIEETRTALEKWIETQRIISQEKRDLTLAKEMLNERIDLVQSEIDTLREKITDAENSIAEADIKRGEMIEEKDKLVEASSSLATTLVGLEKRTHELIVRLPDPIRDRIKPLSQQLPKEGEETKLSTAARFQNVIGILNEVDKFNGDITVTSEIRSLEGGSTAEVTALYLGIGQSFYSGAKGTISGIGYPDNQRWVWAAANESAAEIAEAIAILNNESVASFVQLPIEIK